ncbi:MULTISPECIES: hypothetical protein [unclassified Solwaraspora]|uniref:hypothetical protein n=1 Tax=unclassified Solwaraspora TaxID=2627926 RepID=UPI00259BB83A|nr:hypothetical protein [Solwaraspora sp. WMMA2056]WJK40495.1 hypothetical protein O7608_29570 [Solwaraspora sp. WMMA2056]
MTDGPGDVDPAALRDRLRAYRRRARRARLRRTLPPSAAILACQLTMVAGFGAIGRHVPRITQDEGALRWAMLFGALVTVAGIAGVMGVFNRLVDEDDLGAALLTGVLLVAAAGYAFCVSVSAHHDREILRIGPSAVAVVTEVSPTYQPLPGFGDPYQSYRMRLLDGDRREFTVSGDVGEFQLDERTKVQVDPAGILYPKLPRDVEPDHTWLWIAGAIPVTLAVASAALLFTALWREW